MDPDYSEPLELWNPNILDQYQVADYLRVAKKYFSQTLKHQEDLMLMWLVRNKYDIRKALQSLESTFGIASV